MLSRVCLGLAAVALAQAATTLKIERLAVHQYEDGPVLPASHEFLPGETVNFSCRISGFQVKADDEQRIVELSWEMQVADPAGVLVEKPQSGRIADRLQREDKTWVPKFITSFVIPSHAPGGTYHITVKVKDDLAAAEIAATLDFQVRGAAIEAAATLAARNFRFLRAEDDTIALNPAAYHPGDMLWARFDIVGYKLGANNSFSVAYGLAIEDSQGKQLFEQPEAAAESGEFFYPRLVVPAALSLSLDKNVAPGAYVLVVKIEDKSNLQHWETRQAFRVQ